MQVSEEFKRRMEGYGLTLVEIEYTVPGHPRLINGNPFIWQFEDFSPDFPRLMHFLNVRWPKEIPDSRPTLVTVAHNRLLKPVQFEMVDKTFRLH